MITWSHANQKILTILMWSTRIVYYKAYVAASILVEDIISTYIYYIPSYMFCIDWLTPFPDASTRTAKLVRWVEVHWTNVLLVVLLLVIPSVKNLPLLLLLLNKWK